MNQKEIKELVELIVEKDIAEFELERGDVKVRIKRASISQTLAPVVQTPAAMTLPTPSALPAAHAAPRVAQSEALPASGPEAIDETGLHIVRSPIVGSYYESPSPGAPAFVKTGDEVKAGQVLCIVEAMKLMNEIESDVAGEIVKMYAANSQPVEYGQPLFAIRVK